MKIICFIFCLYSLTTIGQNRSNLSFNLSKLIDEKGTFNFSNKSAHDIHVFLKGDFKELSKFVIENAGTIKYSYGNILAVRIPVNQIRKLLDLEGLQKAEFYSSDLNFHDEIAVGLTSVDSVHSNLGNLTTSYTGKGVVYGTIDSGIDPTHEDFQNQDGSTRILSFWNQNDTASSLAPYGYGKEYTKSDIDNGLMSSYEDTVFNGHGTAVTGVAAGSGRAHSDIVGMAPEADIIVVGINPSVLNYLDWTPSRMNIVDAIHYIFTKAEELGKPAVINISLGGLEGSHDGRDLPTQLIDAMLLAKNGRSLVVSAGNSANTKHHVQHQVQNDTSYTWYKSMFSNSSVCKRDSGAYMSFYGDSTDVLNLLYKISAENRSPCCNILDEIEFRPFLQELGNLKIDTLTLAPNVSAYLRTYVEKIDNTYGLFIEIETDSMELLWRFSVTGTGKIDGWAGPLQARSCNSEYILHPFSVGSPNQIPDWKNYAIPDNNQTIGNAYACSDKVITVGAYSVRNSMYDVDSVLRIYGATPKARASFSSLGPSRDNRIKPDIMGPGSRIVSAHASQVLFDKSVSARSTLYLEGKHAITDGTSFSSPAVAGIVALYFEKYPDADYLDVKNAILSTADQDALTGFMIPNNSNGYGRINAYQMLLYPPRTKTKDFGLEGIIYPNPSLGDFKIILQKSFLDQEIQIYVYDLMGRIVYEGRKTGYAIDLSLPNNGVFIVQIAGDNGYKFIEKVLIQNSP